MTKITLANGVCYVLIAAANPWAQFLGSSQEVSARMIAATAVASVVAGATAFKAFLSTSVAEDQQRPETGNGRSESETRFAVANDQTRNASGVEAGASNRKQGN